MCSAPHDIGMRSRAASRRCARTQGRQCSGSSPCVLTRPLRADSCHPAAATPGHRPTAGRRTGRLARARRPLLSRRPRCQRLPSTGGYAQQRPAGARGRMRLSCRRPGVDPLPHRQAAAGRRGPVGGFRQHHHGLAVRQRPAWAEPGASAGERAVGGEALRVALRG